MAATRLIALHINKGKTVAQCLADRTDYSENAAKTEDIIFNSTTLDCTRKFRDFRLSGLALARLSDIVCLEHRLSVIVRKPYGERQKRTEYPEKNRSEMKSARPLMRHWKENREVIGN